MGRKLVASETCVTLVGSNRRINKIYTYYVVTTRAADCESESEGILGAVGVGVGKNVPTPTPTSI
jgi:hypothetical protein